MIEQSSSIISNNRQTTPAHEAFEMAIAIYKNINQADFPGEEVSRYDLFRNGPKNIFSGVTDFFKSFADGYDRQYSDYHIEPEFVWTLEQTKRSEFLRMPVRGYFVKQGLLLGTWGKLIEFSQGKHEYINYKILDEKSIKDPGHVIELLGKFVSENSIDYSAR